MACLMFGCVRYWILVISVYYILFLVACAGCFGFKCKGVFFLAAPDSEVRFRPAFRIRAVVFYVFCELWTSEWNDSYLVVFVIDFRSFRYIIHYFWLLLQGVLVLKAKEVFFSQSLKWRVIFGRRSVSGLWCFVFSMRYGHRNGIIYIWLCSLLNSGRFSISYTIFGGLFRVFRCGLW